MGTSACKVWLSKFDLLESEVFVAVLFADDLLVLPAVDLIDASLPLAALLFVAEAEDEIGTGLDSDPLSPA